ncbi:Protein of unknown function precursor; putative adhesin [Flavobacterium indicum GPTSA100-9 = DSM 17447]|uniref:PKD domain-containing protein n=1 Tax=Flavobacterium indicum (strain DSM 17447 / CIP 109464 / GPTSA100-9) TaxID=1094466 RepID=H8XPK4_FLAIG|nr:PKD domain-containing protein [Flavobacterium indicum]CCG53278.1 Protein of unknown function precursor; putative adhesin [Flavobacterium indicum GPTSA100-9 = DSM 17447]
MKTKITPLILSLCFWISFTYGQFTTDKPDLRNCGSAPNYYLDYFNCTSNNYTLDNVYLSISSSSGVPITTPCTPPNIQNVYLWLNYTSNSNSAIHQTRIFADILVKDQNGNLIQTLQINSYLGVVNPGSGLRLLNIPGFPSGFPWTCGYELSLSRILIVWKTNGNTADPELSSYTCNTFSKSQCELPNSLIVSAPLAVQFDYTYCTTGSTTTVNFDDDTNGGKKPYSYLWNFGDGTTSTQQSPSHTYPFPGGPYTVTLQVTDSSSPPQISTSTQTITLPDPIQITGLVNSSPCSSGNTGSIDLSVSGGTPPYTYSWSNGATSQDLSNLANGSYTVTVTDKFNCTATKTFIINGGDVTPPVVVAPSNKIIEGCSTNSIDENGNLAYSSSLITISESQFISAGGSINDTSSIASITYIDSVSGTCPIIVSRVYTIKDACNNTTQVTQTFTIQDTTAPAIAIQAANQTVECDGNGNTAALNAWLASNGGASATDACSNVTWTNNFSSVSDTCGATGSATVTFTATDNCGNSTSSTATFTIQDTTAPVIAIQAANQTVECDGNGNTTALNAWLASNGGASATDACSNVTWTNNFSSVSDTCGATGSATVTFTATDNCGNSSTSTATFTIQDTTAPVIAIQAANQTVECDGNGNTTALNAWLASNGGASATDACSNVTWTNNFSSVSDTCGATGSATVTFTATDNCGNSTSTTATFTIQDTTAPVIAIQAANQTVECDGNGNSTALNAWLASNGGASATDACSNVTWTNNFTSLSDTCGATGSATVTFTATDTCGNSTSSTATFTIQDTTAPVIAIQAANQTVECDGNGNSTALNAWLASNGGASATDACSNVTWTNNFTSLSDTCGATGSATVTFTATDNCGNSTSTTATFTIQDTTAPVIAIQAANQTVECDGNGNSTALNAWLASNGGASATDACSNVTWTNNFTSLSDTCGATGSATVTFTATDTCGNSTSTTATFTIQDTTAPVIAIQAANQTVECDGNGNSTALNAWLASNGGASATDACSNVTWTNNFTSLSDTCGATGSATVTFTATDTCGNSTSTTATFTIQDTTAPVIAIQAANQTVECDGNGNSTALNAWLASNGGASATDACSNVTWTNNFSSLSDTCGATGSATVTFTATDTCGNSSSSTATFTIQDTTAPVIAIQAANQTVECDGNGNSTALNAWLASNGGASASDACSSVTWTNNFNSLSDTCGATGSATVTFTATDNCGNSASSTATFTIQDTTAPVICDSSGKSNCGM